MSKHSFTAEIAIEESQVPKIDKWDWNAAKNALDDSARKFLTSQKGFVEDHSLMNGRLILSTVAVLFSLYAIVDDFFFHPFPQSIVTLCICVPAYFFIIALLTYYTNYVERGCFAAAQSKLDNNSTFLWKVYSKQKPRMFSNSKSQSDDVYVLDLELVDQSSNKTRTLTYEKSISKYFDEDGILCTKQFYADLCKYFLAFNSEEKKTK